MNPLIAAISLALIGLPALAEETAPLPVPSGQKIYFQDLIEGREGPNGLTHRFRFVAPGLAYLIPPAEPEPMERLTDEDMAALEDLAASERDPAAEILADALQDGLISAEELEQLPLVAFNGIAAATRALAEDNGGSGADPATAVPRAPDLLVRDPMHDDIVWLCEHFVLPRLAETDPPPTEIVISLADRELDETGLAVGAVQLFEAFSLPEGRDACIWEPF
ncbi:DUF6497 family protein [Paracoccus sediminicola]|uniref:DUF6497 family protein n=1 Tax=Paracoccus sediminicola TaxID=3017783 RepID=UPI0022EFF548|nr:DUF6497 family protein [Paracoccus sediminicola]WBU57936.1 DUF6497 family protein [Paracoccus sediminicola]